MADALQGALGPIPATPEQRQEAANKVRAKELAELNPYKTGNLTQILELESLAPAQAKAMRQEMNLQNPIERLEAQQKAAADHAEALNASMHRNRGAF